MRTLLAAICASVALASCAEAEPDARTALIVSALTRADNAVIRTRPTLMAARYARMAGAPYDYYRGAVAVFLRDWRDDTAGVSRSRFSLDAPLVLSTGDAHPENFGTLRAPDGAAALEANDFDSADRAPYLWDLRRLTAGMCLAARLSNEDSPAARALTAARDRDVARAAADGYARAIARAARGERLDATRAASDNPMLEDLFRRSERDAAARTELTEFTVLDGAHRRHLRRGSLDPTDPTSVAAELSRSLVPATQAALDDYRRTLIDPPPAGFFTLLDAVRELGSGVASMARIRVLLLVRGPTDSPDDDVILELKELADPVAAAWLPPGVFFDSTEARVRQTTRLAWGRPDADPLWSTTRWLTLPVQIRTETGAAKTVRVSRMTGARGTAASLTALAASLGETLARIHAARLDGASPAGAIAARIAADPSGFRDEQADAGCAYATVTLADYARFRSALATLGPTLGLTPSPEDHPSADLAALLASDPR